jgi:hypothetical protein
MTEVTITHVIGTVTLILVFVSVTLFYQYYYLSLQKETLARQLEEAANYVASNLADLISLCLINPADQLAVKTLDIPEKIGESYYSVTITRSMDSYFGDEMVIVKVYLNSDPFTLGEAILPFTLVNVWNGTGSINLDIVQPRLIISSGTSNSVMWALAKNGTITIGLGIKIG